MAACPGLVQGVLGEWEVANAIWDVLQTKLVRRQVPLKNLTPGKIEPAASAPSLRR